MCNEPSRLVGLASRVQEFKPLTNATILILAAAGGIKMGGDLSITSIQGVKAESVKEELLEAAQKLSSIFADMDVVSIYRTLGLKSL